MLSMIEGKRVRKRETAYHPHEILVAESMSAAGMDDVSVQRQRVTIGKDQAIHCLHNKKRKLKIARLFWHGGGNPITVSP
jgi:hypothetical protein